MDHKTLEEIRLRAVERVQAGESPEDAIRTLRFQPELYLDLAGAVPRRRLGRLAKPGVEGPLHEDTASADALALPNHRG